MMRIVLRVFVTLAALIGLWAAEVLATPITFDFENFAATGLRSGALTNLTDTRSGLTMTVSRQNDVFDIVDSASLIAKPPSFGSRSLSPFARETNSTSFVVNFSNSVRSVSVAMGDFGADLNDNLRIEAFSGSGATGNLLALDVKALPTLPGNPFNSRTLSVASNSGIRSVRMVGGTAAFPNSVFYDNIVVDAIVSLPDPKQAFYQNFLDVGINFRTAGSTPRTVDDQLFNTLLVKGALAFWKGIPIPVGDDVTIHVTPLNLLSGFTYAVKSVACIGLTLPSAIVACEAQALTALLAPNLLCNGDLGCEISMKSVFQSINPLFQYFQFELPGLLPDSLLDSLVPGAEVGLDSQWLGDGVTFSLATIKNVVDDPGPFSTVTWSIEAIREVPTAVPLPSSLILVGLGMTGLIVLKTVPRG